MSKHPNRIIILKIWNMLFC